jgi:DNA-binding CsgD family transcriptional regulator
LPSDRVTWGKIVAVFVRLGWSPPPLKDHQAQRLLDDMAVTGYWGETLDLSPVELRSLERVAYGDTVDEIASRFAWSPDTVKTIQARARHKLGARNSANAVAIAVAEELIRSDTGWQEAA